MNRLGKCLNLVFFMLFVLAGTASTLEKAALTDEQVKERII
jgi:hypothetical protein